MMIASKSKHVRIPIALLLASALIVLACGESNSISAKLTPTATAKVNPKAQFELNHDVSFVQGGLVMKADYASHCTASTEDIINKFFVLTNPASGLTAQQFAAFQQYDPLSNAPAPTGVAIVPGIKGNDDGCEITLSVTNTTNQPLTLLRAGVRSRADSVPNTYTYNLVTYCLTINSYDCGGAGGSTSNCSVDIQLYPQTTGQQQDQPITPAPSGPGSSGCQPNLQPGGIVDVTYSLTTNTSSQIYGLVPYLTFSSGQSNQKTVFADDQNGFNAVFYDPSQLKCFTPDPTTLRANIIRFIPYSQAPSTCE